MRFRVVRNDISQMKADAIVCPSNRLLKEGSGTSTAIYNAAGRKSLTKACSERLGNMAHPGRTGAKPNWLIGKKTGVPVGCSVVTSAYNLDAQIIIHTVVPKWRDGNHGEYEKLSEAYLSALTIADRSGCRSLALPLLASGNMGFDLDIAIEVATGSIDSYEPVNKLSDTILITYGSLATQRMRELGYEVVELIDERYVQENDENHKPYIAHAANVAKDSAKDFVEQAIKVADDIMSDKKIHDFIVAIAVDVAVAAIGKKIPAAKGMLQEAAPILKALK